MTLPILRLLVSLALSLPLVAGVPLSPRTVGTLPNASSPKIASNGDGFLASWGTSHTVLGAALDRDGQRSGDLFSIETPRCFEIFPSGSFYVQSCFTGAQPRIRVLSADGQLLTIMEPDLPAQQATLVAVNGDRLLFHSGGLYVVDRTGRRIAGAVDLPREAALRGAGATPDGFFVATSTWTFERGTELQLLRLSIDGTVSTRTVVESYKNFDPAFASAGDSIFSVSSSHAPVREVEVVVIRRDGSVLRTRLDPVSYGNLQPRRIIAIPDGAILLATRFSDGGNGSAPGFFIRLDRNGAPRDPAPVPLTGPRAFADAASNGETLHVLTLEPAGLGDKVIGMSFDLATLALRSDHLLSLGPLAQTDVAVAASGDDAIVVWREHAAERMTIKARLLLRGVPRGETLEIFSSTLGASVPHVAASNNVFLVVWSTDSQIKGRRVSSDGSFLDAAPIIIRRGAAPPLAVAGSDREFLIVWDEGGPITSQGEIRLAATTLGASGGLAMLGYLTPPTSSIFSSGSYHEWEERTGVSAIWDGSRYLVVWSHEVWESMLSALGMKSRELRLLEIDTNLKPGGAASGGSDLGRPRIAAGRDGYLVIAENENRTIPIVGLDRAMNVTSRVEMPRGPFNPLQYPAAERGGVVWDGADYVFTWADRSAIYTGRRKADGATHLAGAPFPVIGNPEIISDSRGGIFIIAAESAPEGRLPLTPRIIVHSEDEFEPLPPRRRRAAGR